MKNLDAFKEQGDVIWNIANLRSRAARPRADPAAPRRCESAAPFPRCRCATSRSGHRPTGGAGNRRHRSQEYGEVGQGRPKVTECADVT